MRQLTFLGFLKGYVKELSLQNTLCISKLVQECARNPRLREPLFLYALESGKIAPLRRALSKDPAETDLLHWCDLYSADALHKALVQEAPLLPENFHKVWRSYCSERDRNQSDNHTKSLMRARILQLQKENAFSNYRLYTELGLNPGNINAWLKHGDARKISLSAARRVLQCAQEQVAV